MHECGLGNTAATLEQQPTGSKHQCLHAGLRHTLEGALHLVQRSQLERHNGQAQCSGSSLPFLQIRCGGWFRGIEQKGGSREMRHKLPQKFETFRVQIRAERSQTCDVTAGPCQATYKFQSNRIGHEQENNWYRSSCCLCV